MMPEERGHGLYAAFLRMADPAFLLVAAAVAPSAGPSATTNAVSLPPSIHPSNHAVHACRTWMMNSSRQLSKSSKDFALLTSKTSTQQSAPR